ncbi:uncharacterized protein Dwil_GK27281 [Drosophila willistoni]|uniref:Uncharacterized protein n=1 Tax=Drosophila willistoni TaxID=7260 RepID=A0A0Q9WQA9_DROWI|nr:uncharacterized protein LOC26529283 [Drosophila willistoni]KRF98388.1 uncharacterized protein Dwil_GK27281 [Drosophila willistoni]
MPKIINTIVDSWRSPKGFLYWQIFGVALIFILISMILLISFGSAITTFGQRNCPAAVTFITGGLLTFCIYVNLLFLRREFPFNWVCSSCIGLLLALGVASVLHGENINYYILLTIEIISIMSLIFVMGSWRPPLFHPGIFIILATISLVSLVYLVMSLIAAACSDCDDDMPIWITHCVLWLLMLPLLLFQSQVINGRWSNYTVPATDAPLCSLCILIDYLAIYAFLHSAYDIEYAFHYIGVKNNLKHLKRVMDADV